MIELRYYIAAYETLKASFEDNPRIDLKLSRVCLKLAADIRQIVFSMVDDDGMTKMAEGLHLQNRCNVLSKHFAMGA